MEIPNSDPDSAKGNRKLNRLVHLAKKKKPQTVNTSPKLTKKTGGKKSLWTQPQRKKPRLQNTSQKPTKNQKPINLWTQPQRKNTISQSQTPDTSLKNTNDEHEEEKGEASAPSER